jgi:acyl-CoA thioesterase-1
MNPVGLYFASGDSLYLGAGLLVLALASSPYLKHRWQLRLRNLATWLALAMIVMACPPFSWWVDAIFLVLLALWFLAQNRGRLEQAAWLRLRRIATVALLVLLIALSASELSHRAMPLISGERSDHLVVIGDSISSGIDSREAAWPDVFQRMTGIPVKNLAKPGAQTLEALTMADKVAPDDRLVLIEIGGNDLLTGVPSNEFEHALDALLSKLISPRRSLVMFELPLLPNKIAYGQAQRRLAAKYFVSLIPKRLFVDVIGGANATSDGLHLSEAGTRQMADLVARVLARALKSGATTGRLQQRARRPSS